MEFHGYESEIKELIEFELKRYPFNEVNYVCDIILDAGFVDYIMITDFDVPKEKVAQVIKKVKKYVSNYSKEYPLNNSSHDLDWCVAEMREDLKQLSKLLTLLKK